MPRVDVDGKYRAFVEIDNEKHQSGNWRLLPGMTGRATFELDQDSDGESEEKPNDDKMNSRAPSRSRELVNAH